MRILSIAMRRTVYPIISTTTQAQPPKYFPIFFPQPTRNDDINNRIGEKIE